MGQSLVQGGFEGSFMQSNNRISAIMVFDWIGEHEITATWGCSYMAPAALAAVV